MVSLRPGDVLSYSAGSTQTGPEGFRKLRPRGDVTAEIGRRWPGLLETLGRGTPLFINAYPAAVGALPGAITVDTYLSPRVLSRALKLACAGGHPVILVGQPLFLADALLRHVAAAWPLPDALHLWVGGYDLPASLERALASALGPHVGRALRFVHFFGAAEVDAGCLIGCDRDAAGALVYHPRADVEVALDGDELLLTLREPDGGAIVERFRTGDRARPIGDGWVVWNEARHHPAIRAELESWSERDWRRRTGYVRRDEDAIWIQLREGQARAPGPGREGGELEFFEFARRFGFSWLDKPCWR